MRGAPPRLPSRTALTSSDPPLLDTPIADSSLTSAMLDATLGALPFPAYAADHRGFILWQSKAALELVGDLRGVHYSAALPPQDLEQARKAWAAVTLSGETTRTTGFFKASDGHLVRHEGINVPIRKEGRIVGVFGMAITSDDVSPEAEPNADLTPRQRDVLWLLVQGKSTREIALELHLAPETVRNHVAGLLDALGARTRLEAVLIALRHGLVSLDLD